MALAGAIVTAADAHRWLVVSTIALLAMLGAIVLRLHLEARYAPSAWWRSPPAVEVCTDAPVALLAVVTEVNWWRERCHEIGPIGPADCGSARAREGTIRIGLADAAHLDGDEAGYTLSSTDGPDMLRAEIGLLDDDASVLRHELGHALGFLEHWPGPRHVMSPRADLQGERDTHLSRCVEG